MFAASFDRVLRYLLQLFLLSAALLAAEAGILRAERPAHTDRHGDPLPDGAIARLGTVRWRHGFSVNALAYSPDGKKIAAVGGGRAITLWDSATGKEIYQFPNRSQPNAVAFAPDGKLLATTDTTICRLWDVAAGKELRQLRGHKNGLRSVAFAPDGKTVATSSYDGTARIWDARSGNELRCLDCKQGNLYSAAYSPDGKLLATGGNDGTIRLWDAAAAKERRKLEGHKKAIWDIVFSPDGKHLASSSEDETIRLWDAATGRQVLVLDEQPQGVRLPIAFSPDGAVLAFARHDGTIRLWDMERGEEKRRWLVGPQLMWALAFSPDGKTLASGGWSGSIHLWDAATGREKTSSDEHRGRIELLRFSLEQTALISFSRDQRLISWDLAAGTPRQLLFPPTERYGGCALSAGCDILAVDGWPDCHLRLWNVRTGKPGLALGKPQKRQFWMGFAFSPDGRLVAGQGEDRVIRIWDAASGKEIRQLREIGDTVINLIFSLDGKKLAGGSEERGDRVRAVHVWDVSSGKEIHSFNGVGPVYALAFSPDGRVLAAGVGGEAYTLPVQLWDTVTGKELCRHTGHREWVASIAFSPDGKLAASGTGTSGWLDNSVHVWESATGRLIRRFEGHHSGVGSVAFSPDGLMAASGAGDSTILLWDITGRRSDGRWHAEPLTPHQLDACWAALANEDAAKAYDAVWALVAAPEQAAPFLQKHLSPAPRPDAKTVARLIADLDSDDFTVRQKANEELSKLGDAIAPALHRALDGKPPLEVRRRLQQLLDQTRDWTSERLRDHRAIQALEHMGTRQAKQVLQALAEGAPKARRTEEAKDAVRRLSH